MSESRVLDILGWVSSSLTDNDDLVASRTKFEALASWLAEQPVLESFNERDEASLDALLAYLADNLPKNAPQAMAERLTEAASVVREVAVLARRASYDAHYEGDEPEFLRIAELWPDAVSTLEELEESGILSAGGRAT
jgi:phosphoglycolate phosphatase-like HAD superfamily hydrolase